MSRESEFLTRWHEDKAAYMTWGRVISSAVQEHLATLIAPIACDYFLKTAIVPRIKDDHKLVEKAFHRKKNYTDPYADITDKVGIRFVVLLGSDTRLVETALRSIKGWTFSKDRDYEEEQKGNPLKFDYAALHFVVRPNEQEEHDGVLIPAGTPCEVQIKTLLQHAYSELTHDTIYKPQVEATHSMQRDAAKAMALLEATNDYFEKVACDVNSALSAVREMTTQLSSVYRDIVGFDPKPTIIEGWLLEAYEPLMSSDTVNEVKRFLALYPFIPDRIRAHVRQHNPIFNQPSILLVYLLVSRSLRKAISAWPLTAKEMEPLLNDLGESIN
ncbi:RelA/SpoT domain-containing protein [Asaia sp. HN010]|uniref:GTP pyrophosphokinase n=1 Tax=Asaia sp. HN010 TaxID=3081233 RepID=UPI003019F80E